MAFNVEFQDKDGNIIDFNRIDSEVCELWKVDSDENDWATLREKTIQTIGMSSLVMPLC